MPYKKIDANQKAVVAALRKIGTSVAITSALGDGFPDMVIGWHGRNYLIELKDGAKVASQKKLTPAEELFFSRWKGQVNKCESLDEILKIINL